MILLYQFEASPFCDKIRRILHTKHVPYTVHNVPLSQTATKLRRINPIGKVPCIDDGGRILADSTDIAYHLEERFPLPSLIPASPRERALCHMLEDWADESLYFYEVRMRLTFSSNAPRTIELLTRDEPGIVRTLAPIVIPAMMKNITRQQGIGRKPEEWVVRDLERHADALLGWLDGREWLVGEALSLADIAVFAQMFCIRSTVEGGRVVSARPGLASWMDRVDTATSTKA
jgi:glutathione S-transferase